MGDRPAQLPMVPGSSTLGQGFDIFGAYDGTSLKASLFDFVDFADGTAITPNGQFSKPWNVNFNPDSANAVGSSFAFSSREEYQEHFGLKAKVGAKVAFFRGGFEAAFNVTSKTKSEYMYGLFEQNIELWNLSIRDTSWKHLSGEVLDDPVFKELPDRYAPDNAYKFFRFFDKYGTHFVKWVRLGGRLYYLVQAKKSFSSDKTTIEGKITLEYKTVLNSATGEVSANWDQLGKQWIESREVHIQVLGGADEDITKLSGVSPVFGQASQKAAYESWMANLKKRPAVVDYQLAGIDEIFEGDKADQVRKAAEAFENSQLVVSSEGRIETIVLNGHPLRGTEVGITTGPTIHVVVVDALLGLPVLNKAYGWEYNKATYDAIHADVSHYEGNPDFIVAITLHGGTGPQANSTSGYIGSAFPTQKFYQFLLSCGVKADLLNTWRDNYHMTTAQGYSTVSLAVIGTCGGDPGSALAYFGHGTYYAAAVNGAPVPRVEAKAWLRPVGVGDGKVRFTVHEI